MVFFRHRTSGSHCCYNIVFFNVNDIILNKDSELNIYCWKTRLSHRF
jgi:hypothetical protein